MKKILDTLRKRCKLLMIFFLCLVLVLILFLIILGVYKLILQPEINIDGNKYYLLENNGNFIGMRLVSLQKVNGQNGFDNGNTTFDSYKVEIDFVNPTDKRQYYNGGIQNYLEVVTVEGDVFKMCEDPNSCPTFEELSSGKVKSRTWSFCVKKGMTPEYIVKKDLLGIAKVYMELPEVLEPIVNQEYLEENNYTETDINDLYVRLDALKSTDFSEYEQSRYKLRSLLSSVDDPSITGRIQGYLDDEGNELYYFYKGFNSQLNELYASLDALNKGDLTVSFTDIKSKINILEHKTEYFLTNTHGEYLSILELVEETKCKGCTKEGVCYEEGIVNLNNPDIDYCYSGSFFKHKENGKSCDENFQCSSNFCSNNICVEINEGETGNTSNLFVNVFHWFRNLFS